MTHTKNDLNKDQVFSQLLDSFDKIKVDPNLLRTITDRVQQKFVVSDKDLPKLVAILDTKGSKVKRVAQTDYYFTPQGIEPDYRTSYIRLREEKLQDTSSVPLFTLTFKSSVSENNNLNELSRQEFSQPLSEDESYAFYEFAEQRSEQEPKKIYKERSTFDFDGVTVNVDSMVMNDDEFVGNFVEVDAEDSKQLARVTLSLMLDQDMAIALPYASLDQFVPQEYEPSSKSIKDTNEQNNEITFGIRHFNAITKSFEPGFPKDLIPQGYSDKQRKLLIGVFSEIITNLKDYNPVKARELYKSYHGMAPFKYYKSPIPYIEFQTLYGMKIPEIIEGGGRMLFSYVRLKDGNSCIMVHLVGTHKQYDEWLDKRRSTKLAKVV